MVRGRVGYREITGIREVGSREDTKERIHTSKCVGVRGEDSLSNDSVTVGVGELLFASALDLCSTRLKLGLTRSIRDLGQALVLSLPVPALKVTLVVVGDLHDEGLVEAQGVCSLRIGEEVHSLGIGDEGHLG